MAGHGRADGRERAIGLLEYVLPKSIYTHKSARVDIWLYLLDRGLMPVWVVAFLGTLAPFIERSTIGGLQWAFGASPEFEPTVGWALHKVHHSAQVLTPLTRSREHQRSKDRQGDGEGYKPLLEPARGATYGGQQNSAAAGARWPNN